MPDSREANSWLNLSCVYQLKFQKGSRFEKWIHFELITFSLLHCKSTSAEQSSAVGECQKVHYILSFKNRHGSRKGQKHSSSVSLEQKCVKCVSFFCHASFFFLEECPGCFQIKWISRFGTLKNLGSNKLENEGKWMTGIDTLLCRFSI